MMASVALFRRGGDNKYSQFYTPDNLAKFTAELANELVQNEPETVIVDPCVGGGALFKYLRGDKEQKKAADLLTDNFKKEFPQLEVLKQDFLESRRSTYVKGGKKMLICMNPPFSLYKRNPSTGKVTSTSDGVLKFLIQSNKILSEGEFVVCIAGQKERQESILIKIPATLHLLKEYIVKDKIFFTDVETFEKHKKTTAQHKKGDYKLDKDGNRINEKKPLNIVVQIWQKQNKPQDRPQKISRDVLNQAPFDLKYDYNNEIFDFYMMTTGNPNTNGSVWDKNLVNPDPQHTVTLTKDGQKKYKVKISGRVKTYTASMVEGKNGSFCGVICRNKGDKQAIMDILQTKFKEGVYKDWVEYRKTTDNPGLNFEQIKRAYLGKLVPFNATENIVILDKNLNMTKPKQKVKTEEQEGVVVKRESAGSSGAGSSGAGSSGKREGERKVSDKRKQRGTGTENDPYIVELMKKWGVVSYKHKLKF